MYLEEEVISVVATVSFSVTSLIVSLGVYLEEKVISVAATVSSSVTYFSQCFTGCVSGRGSDKCCCDSVIQCNLLLSLFHWVYIEEEVIILIP